MARFTEWFDKRFSDDRDYLAVLRYLQEERQEVVWNVQHDLAIAAANLGQSRSQIESKIDDLFSTFGAEWSVFILAGATSIVDAITNDTTLSWLDVVYPQGSGVTIRTRLLNRLAG